MIIESLAQHWPARKPEWLMAGLTGGWGLYAIYNPSIFDDPAMARLGSIAQGFDVSPAFFWGWILFLTGILRFVALFINGAYVRTPTMRAVAAFVTMFIFTQISISLFNSGVPNHGMIIYPWLVVVDLLSTYRAGQDAVYAETQRRNQKELVGADLPYLRAD